MEARGTEITLPVGKVTWKGRQLLGWDPDRQKSIPRYEQLDLYTLMDDVVLYAI